MSELKTKPTLMEPKAFIDGLSDEKKRNDADVLLTIMSDITQQQPTMWGDSLIGFGQYKYQYASGRKGEWFRVGFSPRKQNLSIYVGAGMSANPELLKNLGKHKTSKACLYINKLADIDMDVLEAIIQADLAEMNKRYPE